MSPAYGASPGHRHFHEQLAAVRQRLLDMAERAEALLDLAVEALHARDADRAHAVVLGDADLDALEVEIEHQAVSLLALQQPMARDLRFMIGAIKVSSDLERVGDHAVNVAQATLRLLDANATLPAGPEIEEMARRARRMLGQAIDAFIRADGVLGREVCRADDAVDRLMETAFRVLLTRMMENPSTITQAIQHLLIARNLERVADLATNIGEDAVYLAEGKQIKHHFEALLEGTTAPGPQASKS
jgi:phosphate transport system protein